ncbi:MAG: fumarylacetoacetate hydrolase family protein [Pseudohongiella sp.]|uniref:fumarylacetoacetate hydrolase family protein n=1 Tax=Pseudohongiella sp. TaxID=1979412 RepID=UPI0034A02DCA
MKYIFELPRVSLPVKDREQQFPVNRVFCVGRNYAEHAKEMGADPDREAPFFFSKPASAVFVPQGEVPYPPRTGDLHHEAELVVALHRGGHSLTVAAARDCVFGYSVGIDFTRRDLQAEAKKQGRPWDTAKGFDASGPMSELVAVEDCGWLDRGAITLSLNGEQKQQGDLSDMIWKVEEIIAELSTYYTLQAGDIIFTGTPAGVGAVNRGDVVDAAIAGAGQLTFRMV